jgi:isoleucyl-tRNA synthetase
MTFSFTEAEKKILKLWNENNIFQKTLDKTKNKPPYTFYDGPPFATGLPHYGHLVASTIKDIIPRYFTMQGHYVERRWGWDCHGLPIEHEIDKKLGMSAQEAVKKLGIKGYNDECRKIVQRYTSEWQETIERLGRWADFENCYKTMDSTFMESVWWVFKKLWDQGLVYRGTKVMPFSTALQTPLSNFEASSNFKDIQDPAITVLFKVFFDQQFPDECAKAIKPCKYPTYFATWTTTPWTLPANLALCVSPNISYVKVFDSKFEIYIILAEECVKNYKQLKNASVVERYSGNDLVGEGYEGLFFCSNDFNEKSGDNALIVLADEFVKTDTGTGIVHMAPAFGEDDARVCQSAGIKPICPIDDNGCFTDEVFDYKGLYVKDADKQIIKNLKDRAPGTFGLLYHQDTITHSYPFCPRSDTPLIYKAVPAWYINVKKIKDKVLESNSKTHWIPEGIRDGRFGDWLKNAKDWCVSRNRVWGTPIPIWINDETGEMDCFGSIEEFRQQTGIWLGGGKDLHREHIDKCTYIKERPDLPPKKGAKGNAVGTYRRIPEVFDCWFESGSMPYAQLHYPFENKEKFETNFPADFIGEGLDQTRGWFYTLMVLSTALFDKPAFKNVIVNGIVLASDGKKMAKRLKNYTDPNIILNQYGADALRLYLMSSGLVRAEEIRFKDEELKETVRRVLLPWYNAFSFFKTYAEIDKFDIDEHFAESSNILDQWILSKGQSLINSIHQEMKVYKLYRVIPALFDYIENLTNWYLRLNRRRFWESGFNNNKKAAYTTLYRSLLLLSKAMAPFAPFFSDYLFQEIKQFGNLDEESVHLCSFPEYQPKVNTSLEDAVSRMQQIIILGRHKREQVKIKVKTPLSELTIIHRDRKILDNITKLESYIKSELNVKIIFYSQNEDNYIQLFAKPNFKVLGPRLGKRMPDFKVFIETLDTEDLEKLEEGTPLYIDGEFFDKDDIQVFRKAKKGNQAISNRFVTIELDCNLTDELIAEGIARETVSQIQKLRKEAEYNVSDRIDIDICTDDNELIKILSKHLEYIMDETLALNIKFNPFISQYYQYPAKTIEINEFSLTIILDKANELPET